MQHTELALMTWHCYQPASSMVGSISGYTGGWSVVWYREAIRKGRWCGWKSLRAGWREEKLEWTLGVAKSNLDAFCYTALTLERCWADRKFIIHYYSLIPWTIWLPWAACSSLRHSGRSEGHPGSLPWSCCDDWQGWEYKAWNATQSSGGEDCSCPGVLSGIPIGVHW